MTGSEEGKTEEQVPFATIMPLPGQKKVLYVRKDLMKEPAPWLDYRTQEAVTCQEATISAGFAALATTKEKELVGKTICGIVLSLKHGTASKQKVYERSNFQSLYMTKRQKLVNTAPYDRLMICGDLTDGGNCFAMIWPDAEEGRKRCFNISGGISLGNIIYIGEPKKQDSTLGSSMPIVKSVWRVIPIMFNATTEISAVLPQVRLVIPKESGEHRYFVYHNLKVEIFGFRLAYEDVSCAGRFCDRAFPRIANVHCGCFQPSASLNPTVGEFNVNVVFPDRTTYEGDNETTIQDFRSLRTTELFFENLEDFASQENLIIEQRTAQMRAKIAGMNAYINENGGWTVVGWFRRGDVTDASTEDAKVEAESVTLHISTLIPSKNLGAEFRTMRIKKVE